MKFSLTVDQLKNEIGECSEEGEFNGEIVSISALNKAKPGDLSFLANTKYKNFVADSKASVILLDYKYNLSSPLPNQLYLRVKDTSHSLAILCKHIERSKYPNPEAGIHPSAVIHEGAKIGKNVHISPYVIVGANAEIGDNSIIRGHTVIGRESVIGSDAYIDANVKDPSPFSNWKEGSN